MPTLATAAPRRYLDATVGPLLLEGLAALAKARSSAVDVCEGVWDVVFFLLICSCSGLKIRFSF